MQIHSIRRAATLLLAACAMGAAAAWGQDAGPVAVPEPSDKALSYYFVGNVLWAVGGVLGLVVPALFLFTGWSARIRDLALRVSPRWPVTVLIYLVVYSVVTFAIGLPLAYYQEFVVEHQFGLSNQSFGKWLGNSLIQLGVGTVIGYLVVLGIYAALRKSPTRWWLYAGLAAIPFVFLMILIAPVWIDPLFNKFGPMKDRGLEAKILALADKAGIEGGRVFEVDKSVDTKATNAYVNGFLATKRIVLWDTIIAKLDEPQLLFVMGHEMGHYAMGHAWKLIFVLCALIALALYAVHRLSRGLIARFSGRFGFTRLDDIASWPLVSLVSGVAMMVAMPAFFTFVRYNEREADRFGIEITRDNHAAASAFVKLQADNLMVPRPNALLHLLRDGHPSLAERIEFANGYRPWEKGEPLRYQEHFRK
jgi:STE24 endopeptidase